MKYKPMTDEEIESSNLIPEATVCYAEVESASEHIGKTSGKASIKLIINVYHNDLTFQLWCFLTPAYAKLWKHAVVSMVSQEDYESGDISAMSFEGKSCNVTIGIDEYNGKKKNFIADISKSEKQSEKLPF